MVARSIIARHSARVEPNASPTREPRLLLAEDDESSRRFLADALASLGWRVTCCGDGHDALQLARAQAFDLLLLDRKLPRLGALALLRALRGDTAAASSRSPALASSAEWTTALRGEAAAAGFAATLDKPIGVARLGEIVAHARGNAGIVLRDDDGALAAAGNTANLTALRRLFVAELDRLDADIAASAIDAEAWPERLHRLCASAGFCGAPALAQASRMLLQALRENGDAEAARAGFIGTLRATRDHFAAG